MTLKVVIPRVISTADILESSVTNEAHSAWSSGTNFAVGDRTIQSEKVYESLQAHTNKSPATAANIGTFWVLVGPINQRRAFDLSTASATTRSGARISFIVKLSEAADTVAALEMSGSAFAIEVIRNDNPLSNSTGISQGYQNLMSYSERLDNAFWTQTNCEVLRSGSNQPFDVGQTEMVGSYINYIRENNGTGPHYVQSGNFNFDNAQQYTFSVFAKQLNGTRNLLLALNPAAFPGSPKVRFNLDNGTVVSQADATGTITATQNGWYRCTITATTDTGGSMWAARIHLTDGANESYNESGKEVFVTGAQMVFGSAALTYMWTLDATGGANAVYGTRVLNRSLNTGATEFVEDGGGEINDAIFTGIGALRADYLGIAVRASGIGTNETRLGELVIGKSYAIGELVDPTGGTILDFSRKDRDDFGNVTLIPRNSADQQNYTVFFDPSKRKYFRRMMRTLRATVAFWYDDEDLTNSQGKAALGFWTEYSDDLTQGPAVFGSLTVESMS